jgi:multidrug efflux system membrane fusion protein
VPTAAIQRGAPGAYVYVINANDAVSVRPVTIGPIDGPTAEVNSGLSVGERVVVDGTDHLRDGARVTISAAPPSMSPAKANPAPNAPNPNGPDPGIGNSAKPGSDGSH